MKSSSGPELRPIGGFFELELPQPTGPFHEGALALSTGRSCLCAILDHEKPVRCYVPHFTCDATLDPFYQRGIELKFYGLDSELRPRALPALEEGECFLVTNYWGLQRDLAASLSAKYGPRLIIDDTHDFHAQGLYPGSWSFTSARKYFGVPDGAFLYTPAGVDEVDVVPAGTPEFQGVSTLHSVSRSLGQQAEAFAAYQAYESRLPCELQRMSSFSRAVLASVDFEGAFARRRANFEALASALGASNTIDVPNDPELTPFVYPFFPLRPMAKGEYHREQIFVPTYWPDVLQRAGVSCEVSLDFAKNLIPFPIDHRYGAVEMQRIVDVTNRLLNA